MRKTIDFSILFGLSLLLAAAVFCQAPNAAAKQFLVVLGTAQDAGYPQIGCERADCAAAQADRNKRELVVSLGLIDKAAGQKWLFEATPDIGEQLFAMNELLPGNATMPDGIFLTHAHIGHYTGLMYLGREAIGARGIPVFAMPRMSDFLRLNAPWSQLVDLKNIELRALENEKGIDLNSNLMVKPFIVPHRDEFSETVGFEIKGLRKTAVFIPDIDKWSKWDGDLKKVIESADYVLIDATFFKNGEIPNRDMSEIPHPFVEETIELLKTLDKKDRHKVIFIHFNHTNPLIRKNSAERKQIEKLGYRVADRGLLLDLS